MNETPAHSTVARHNRGRMSGRDRAEGHRAATPLELLYDLTLVIGFGVAASQLAHALAEGHALTGIVAFTFTIFWICWAWTNFSWFSSAYDIDDWVFRLLTMVQMIGVVVLSLGVPLFFDSFSSGSRLGAQIMTLGYVIMRLSMVYLWLRAALDDPAHRRACLVYAAIIFWAQVGWSALALADLALPYYLAGGFVLSLVELAGPAVAESRDGGTPWHAHHISERYGLLAIIALGEGVVGTVASVSALVEKGGWSPAAVVICAAGVALTFGMWWTYFLLSYAEILDTHRRRAFVWGYGHIFIFASIAATGAGLHVAAYFIQGKAHINATAAISTIAIPVGLFLAMIYALYSYMLRSFDALHAVLLALTALTLLASVAMASLGVGLLYCLLALTCAPAVTVIGYETLGHRHVAQAFGRTGGPAPHREG